MRESTKKGEKPGERGVRHKSKYNTQQVSQVSPCAGNDLREVQEVDGYQSVQNEVIPLEAKRDERGRFLPGTAPGPGNPYARRVAALRAALLEAVTEDDIREIVQALVRQAKAGEVVAAREVLLRVLGKPLEADILERLEALEEVMARGQHIGAFEAA